MFQGPTDEKPKPLALASAPGRDPLELLVKAVDADADALLALRAGETVRCTSPGGPGYPVGRAEGGLLLLATGSALAPIRAALQVALERDPPPSPIRLIVGARDERSLAFRPDIERWQKQGVVVDVIYSQPDGATENGDASPIRVQTLLEGPLEGAEGLLVFVCGQPTMMDESEALLIAGGVAKERIFRNF